MAMRETRRRLTEPRTLRALAHPVRLQVIGYLMSNGPATASVCARAVGDTPSNCSYHLRALAREGLVEEATSLDGRERPWRALVTGFDTPSDDAEGAMTPEGEALLAVMLQVDHRSAAEYLARRDQIPPQWRAADLHATYGLRLSPAELVELRERLDGLIRPYVAATREQPPEDAALVHLGLQAFLAEG
jgi:DNA-binding transcriptional ArsR family regulator